MHEILFLCILFLLSTIIPILVNFLLKRLKVNGVLRIVFSVLLGIGILFSPLLIFSSANQQPSITKKISKEYNFEQQEYGMAFGSFGTYCNLYRNNDYWLDEHLGQIVLIESLGDFDIEISESDTPMKRVTIKEKDKIILDTTLSFSKKFDFEY